LIQEGAYVQVYDPVSIKNAAMLFSDNSRITFCVDEYEAAKNADAIAILTEWNQFRHLDLNKIKNLMKNKYFFDYRNVYEPEDVKKCGFIYYGVGRK
jgi:UDPglucose 6-dehydrogenase